MSEDSAHRDRPASSRFHPLIYKLIAGLALWFVLAAWGFAGSSYIGYLLAVVSGFFLLAVGLPAALWLTSHKDRHDDANAGPGNFLASWASGEFDTWTGRVKGKIAVIEALLPIAAVAIGMTAFVVALHIAVHVR